MRLRTGRPVKQIGRKLGEALALDYPFEVPTEDKAHHERRAPGWAAPQ